MGRGRVVRQNVLRESVTLQLEEGRELDVSLDEIESALAARNISLPAGKINTAMMLKRKNPCEKCPASRYFEPGNDMRDKYATDSIEYVRVCAICRRFMKTMSDPIWEMVS